VDTSTAAGDEQQRKRVADDEGSDKEGGKGDGKVTRVADKRRQRR
jgi:hypothetical protein